MAWLDLVVPSAAILALFGLIALVVVAVLQARRIRRLEDTQSRLGTSAVEAPLQRIAELQARHAVSSGVTPDTSGQMRAAGVVALVALALISAIGGVWYLFVRDGGTDRAAETPAAASTASTSTAPGEPATPVDATVVPESVPVISDKSIYTVMVFNATGIAGAAGDVIAPNLAAEGWNVLPAANEPDGVTGRKESVVLFTRGKRKVAWSVAKDIGVKRAPPLDGYSAEEIGNADVVVLVGLDLATGAATVTTP